jgi:hypothetical protein
MLLVFKCTAGQGGVNCCVRIVRRRKRQSHKRAISVHGACWLFRANLYLETLQNAVGQDSGVFWASPFHMTEYLRRKTRPFTDWSDNRYDECIERFIEVINTFNPYGFAVQVPRDDFNALISPPVKRQIVHDPYILVLDTAITMVLRRMYFQRQDEQVTMYFHRTSFASKQEKSMSDGDEMIPEVIACHKIYIWCQMIFCRSKQQIYSLI